MCALIELFLVEKKSKGHSILTKKKFVEREGSREEEKGPEQVLVC